MCLAPINELTPVLLWAHACCRFALREAGVEEPALFDDTPGASTPGADGKLKSICLVDHNEEKQMVSSLRSDPQRKKRIVGLIDHHAVAESFSTDAPIFCDVRPWGSMSAIVAHIYMRNNAQIRPPIAKLLMLAILSDTLNLQSVTTTDADRFTVALLAKISGVEDPDEVARLMFKAKTDWIVGLGPYAMVRGDQKDFCVDRWKFGIAVLEVTTMEPVLAVAADLIVELRLLKKDKGGADKAKRLDFAFLFVVDVAQQCSVLLVCGGRELALARHAFPNCPLAKAHPSLTKGPGTHISADQTMIDVGPLVSRKAQFVPAFSKILGAGFTCHRARTADGGGEEPEGDALEECWATPGKAEVYVDAQQRLCREGSARHVLFESNYHDDPTPSAA